MHTKIRHDIIFTADFGRSLGHGCGLVVGGDSIEESSLEPIGSMNLLPLQQLKWQAHMVSEWHGLCDGALQDM